EHGDESHAILDECGDETHLSGGWGDGDGNAESWVEDAAPQDESWVEAKDSDARNPWPADQDWDDTWAEASKDSDARNPCLADQGWDDTRVEASKDSDATKPWHADQAWDDTYDPSADTDRWWLEESAVPWPETGEGQGSDCMWGWSMDETEHPDDQDFPDPTDDDIFNGFIETMGIDMNEEAPGQPDYHDDDLANHDMEEAQEAHEPVHPFPDKPHLSTRPINPHAQRLFAAEPHLKFKEVRERWWTSDERTTVLSTIPVKEQKKRRYI
ncbi:unnamed protein product, partial [Symbiodinium sp. KB8]